MNGDTNHSLGQLPEEMFTLIKTSSQSLGPRLGRLSLAGRKQIETPHYLANTSRGVVPHITQDTFRRDTHISGAYYALEDCKSFPLPIIIHDSPSIRLTAPLTQKGYSHRTSSS